ncbi:hypothetical protein JTE90_020067 [Oedothorax gibbosus]|uniref:Uncharacterized protein n=1 Tax=Oedothorax gibbosus TaxID=931172 RepID=A0AAV6UTY5_9ARAC|nr:hypothetical protein JTE90_020067 [Oedothorax gibbosus]
MAFTNLENLHRKQYIYRKVYKIDNSRSLLLVGEEIPNLSISAPLVGWKAGNFLGLSQEIRFLRMFTGFILVTLGRKWLEKDCLLKQFKHDVCLAQTFMRVIRGKRFGAKAFCLSQPSGVSSRLGEKC